MEEHSSRKEFVPVWTDSLLVLNEKFNMQCEDENKSDVQAYVFCYSVF